MPLSEPVQNMSLPGACIIRASNCRCLIKRTFLMTGSHRRGPAIGVTYHNRPYAVRHQIPAGHVFVGRYVIMGPILAHTVLYCAGSRNSRFSSFTQWQVALSFSTSTTLLPTQVTPIIITDHAAQQYMHIIYYYYAAKSTTASETRTSRNIMHLTRNVPLIMFNPWSVPIGLR